jgi:ribose transport system substrate-binding protein
MKMLALPLLTVLLTALVAGCGSSGPADASGPADLLSPNVAQDRGTIGFSALTLKNPFFKIIADSLTEEARRHGYRVIVSDAERDVNEQAKHVDNFIAQQVTAIVLNPADRIAIGPAIKKANEAGIPVFTCDLECVAEDVQIAGHVGTDNFQGGELAGEAMIEALGDDGGQVLIVHFRQANSCVLRVEGFRKVIDAYNAGRDSGRIEIVAELEGGGLRDEGFRATSDALQAHPDLAGIFAINDPSALGAWTALQQAGKADQVTLIGFDGQLEGKQAILEGKIYADPIQFPEKMGVLTVQNILKYLDGEPFEKVQLIPTVLYRQVRRPAGSGTSGSLIPNAAGRRQAFESSRLSHFRFVVFSTTATTATTATITTSRTAPPAGSAEKTPASSTVW